MNVRSWPALSFARAGRERSCLTPSSCTTGVHRKPWASRAPTPKWRAGTAEMPGPWCCRTRLTRVASQGPSSTRARWRWSSGRGIAMALPRSWGWPIQGETRTARVARSMHACGGACRSLDPLASGASVNHAKDLSQAALDGGDHGVRKKRRSRRFVPERRAKLCVVKPLKGGDEALRKPCDPTNARELRREGLLRGVLVEGAVIVDEK